METNFTIDWLSITSQPSDFPGFLQYAYPCGEMFVREKPVHGYNNAVSNANFARIMWHSTRKEMGVHTQYSGQSLNIYEINGTAKKSIVDWHVKFGSRCTRIDIAIDVRDSGLVIRKLYNMLRKGKAKTRLATWNILEGPQGTTLYLGSRQSEQFLRIYDKGMEQQSNEEWKRIELELKGSRAETVAKRIASMGDHELAPYAQQSIRGLVDFPTALWIAIMGDMSIGIAKAKEGQTDTVAWLLGSVAPAMGKHIRKYGDNGLTEKFLAVVAGFSEAQE